MAKDSRRPGGQKGAKEHLGHRYDHETEPPRGAARPHGGARKTRNRLGFLTRDQALERSKKFAARLAQAVDQSGKRDVEIAAAIGVGESYVRKLIVTGDAQSIDPGFFKIMALALELNVSPWYLAMLSDDPRDGL